MQDTGCLDLDKEVTVGAQGPLGLFLGKCGHEWLPPWVSGAVGRLAKMGGTCSLLYTNLGHLKPLFEGSPGMWR